MAGARYHSSAMDVENLRQGQRFRELPETYTIFITERDFFGKGEPVYRIERMNLETGEPFGDGGHILYVNGEYRGETDLGRLMHDFNCTRASDMNFGLMAERTRYYKESEEGVAYMCKIMEDMRNEAADAAREEGRKEGKIEGKIEGKALNKIRLMAKKVAKHKTLEQTAEDLEERPEDIRALYDIVCESAPEYDEDRIYQAYIARTGHAALQ